MESSDDSFVWSDASISADSTDSDNRSVEYNKMKDRHYESEAEKNYKKKLHKNLFKTEPEVKHELLNGDRVKHEEDSDDLAPPATPSVATSSSLKRKRKRERTPSPDAQPGLDYLDALVKQEQHAHSDSQDEPPKKKKSKKKKEHKESCEMIIEDKFTAEETVVETRPEKNTSLSINVDSCNEFVENVLKKEKKKKKKKKKRDSVGLDLKDEIDIRQKNYHEDEISTPVGLDLKGEIDVRQNNNHENEISTPDTYENHSLENDNETREIITATRKNKDLNTSTTKSTKISDLIQFEDGEDVITASNEAIENNICTQSSKLRRFLKANPHLHPLTSTSNTSDPLITQDDDIWLLNCPHDMKISSLEGTNLSLDDKCKIKIDSETFIGYLDCEVNRLAILTSEQNRPVIKSFVVNGIVNFRKRIPKAHYLEDNMMSNNQTDFISLPDTKCRHPLFGPDYKKAIKLPAAVKCRLANPPLESVLVHKQSKKKKKRKHDEIELCRDEVDAGGEVANGVSGDGRGLKRRRSEKDSDQPSKKKAKRIKQESAETWDSERAIEENLFNY